MAKKKSRKVLKDVESVKILTEHARWIAERLERINEGLIQRASYLLSFLVIEIGAVVSFVAIFKGTLSVSLIFLLIEFFILVACSIFYLIKTLIIHGEFPIPTNQELEKAYKGGKKKMSNKAIRQIPLEQLLLLKNKKESYYRILLKENEIRGPSFKKGVYWLGSSQLGLVVFLLVLYYRK